jgi:hypothetical protein
MPRRGQLLVHDALGCDAARVTAVLDGIESARHAGFAELLQIALRDVTEPLPPLLAVDLVLDLLHAPMDRRRMRQELLLGERARLVHQLPLFARVEERLPVVDGPASGHRHVVDRDGLEAVVAHHPMAPFNRRASMVRSP